MTDLKTIIQKCFEYRNYSGVTQARYLAVADSPLAYMTIPLQGDIIEIPTFAMYAFAIEELKKNQGSLDAIVIGLDSLSSNGYKSVDAQIRSVLSLDYNCHHLIKIYIDSLQNPCYYGINGALFNKDLVPQIMMTWQMKKIKDANSNNETWKYSVVKPILRVNPSVIIDKSNAVEKYIVNKIIPNALSIYRVLDPYISQNPSIMGSSCNLMTIKVEIDKFPFKFDKVDSPSISTTNEKLLKVALGNVDEMVL